MICCVEVGAIETINTTRVVEKIHFFLFVGKISHLMLTVDRAEFFLNMYSIPMNSRKTSLRKKVRGLGVRDYPFRSPCEYFGSSSVELGAIGSEMVVSQRKR